MITKLQCLILGSALVSAGADVVAQTTVYQCETAKGTVFSGQPCAAASDSSMKVMHLKEPVAPDSAEVARRAGVREQAAEDSWQLALERQESNCIENRAAATRRGTQRRVEDLQRQINRLRNRTSYANNNLAGATWENGLREQIAGLQAAISSEKQIRVQTELNAQSVCAQQRSAAAAAHRRP